MHSFNSSVGFPIYGLDTALNNSKLKYPPLCRKGLVLARIWSSKKLAFLISQHQSITGGKGSMWQVGLWLPLTAILAIQIMCCIPSCLA
jgi:hypothetical protein